MQGWEEPCIVILHIDNMQNGPNQSKDPSPTIPTYIKKEDIGREQPRPIKRHCPCS